MTSADPARRNDTTTRRWRRFQRQDDAAASDQVSGDDLRRVLSGTAGDVLDDVAEGERATGAAGVLCGTGSMI